MNTNFEYLAPASLNTIFNRQSYGPLDLSQVFVSKLDLDYYRTGGTLSALSEYTYNAELSGYVYSNVEAPTADDKLTVTYPKTPYPYAGQILSLVDNTAHTAKAYMLIPNVEKGYFDLADVTPIPNVIDGGGAAV